MRLCFGFGDFSLKAIEMGGIVYPLLLMACYVILVESWKCGQGSSCDCYSDMWVRCSDIKASPHFKMSVRKTRNLLITVTPEDEFDIGSLHVTEGFNYVGIIVYDMADDYCARVTNEFPWVKCFAEIKSRTENDNKKSSESLTNVHWHTTEDVTSTTETLMSTLNAEKSTTEKS